MTPRARNAVKLVVGLLVLGLGVKLLTDREPSDSPPGSTPAPPREHKERPSPFAPLRSPARTKPTEPAPAPPPAEPQPAPPRTPSEVLARLAEGKQVVLKGKCQCQGELVLTADTLRFDCPHDRDRSVLFARSDVDRVDKNGVRIPPLGSRTRGKTYHFKIDGMTNDEVHAIFTGWLSKR